jgi:hypothetical protein
MSRHRASDEFFALTGSMTTSVVAAFFISSYTSRRARAELAGAKQSVDMAPTTDRRLPDRIVMRPNTCRPQGNCMSN